MRPDDGTPFKDNPALLRQVLRELQRHFGLAVAESDSNRLVGDVGLYLSEDGTFAELGFTLARDEHGKGHATRAAELVVQQLSRLCTVTEVRAVTDRMSRASMARKRGEALGCTCSASVLIA